MRERAEWQSLEQQELKQVLLLELTKLSDRDTQRSASETLHNIVEHAQARHLPLLLTCLYATESHSPKAFARRECVLLFATLAQHQAGHLAAQPGALAKVVSSVCRRLRDSDSKVREACAHALGQLAAHVPVGSSASLWQVLLKPLMEQTTEQNGECQGAALLSLQQILVLPPAPSLTAALAFSSSSSRPPATTPTDTARKSSSSPHHSPADGSGTLSSGSKSLMLRLLHRLLRMYRLSTLHARTALVSTLGTLVQKGSGAILGAYGCATWVPPEELLPTLSVVEEALRHAEWSVRRAACEAAAQLLSQEWLLSSDAAAKGAMVGALERCRHDRIKPVREAAAHTLRIASGALPPPSLQELQVLHHHHHHQQQQQPSVGGAATSSRSILVRSAMSPPFSPSSAAAAAAAAAAGGPARRRSGGTNSSLASPEVEAASRRPRGSARGRLKQNPGFFAASDSPLVLHRLDKLRLDTNQATDGGPPGGATAAAAEAHSPSVAVANASPSLLPISAEWQVADVFPPDYSGRSPPPHLGSSSKAPHCGPAGRLSPALEAALRPQLEALAAEQSKLAALIQEFSASTYSTVEALDRRMAAVESALEYALTGAAAVSPSKASATAAPFAVPDEHLASTATAGSARNEKQARRRLTLALARQDYEGAYEHALSAEEPTLLEGAMRATGPCWEELSAATGLRLLERLLRSAGASPSWAASAFICEVRISWLRGLPSAAAVSMAQLNSQLVVEALEVAAEGLHGEQLERLADIAALLRRLINNNSSGSCKPADDAVAFSAAAAAAAAAAAGSAPTSPLQLSPTRPLSAPV